MKMNQKKPTHKCFHLLNIISGNHLWPEEVKYKYCKNSAWNHNVLSQAECQERCIMYDGCVGISYSYKDYDRSRGCYVCMDDNLTTAGNEFGFYRRPGIVDG